MVMKMKKGYNSITSLDEVCRARAESEWRVRTAQHDVALAWQKMADSVSPGRVLSSTFDGVVSLLADLTMVRRGYRMVRSIIERLLPPEEIAKVAQKRGSAGVHDEGLQS